MKEIILIGGGGHCKSVIDVIEQESQFVIVGIVDKLKLIGTDVLGYPVIGSDADLESLAKIYTYALVTVGQIRSPEARIKLFFLIVIELLVVAPLPIKHPSSIVTPPLMTALVEI